MIIIYIHENKPLDFTCAVRRVALAPNEHPVIVPRTVGGMRQDIHCSDCDKLIDEEV